MSHEAMWSYFQNEAPDVFMGAETRVRALLRLARSERSISTLLNIGAGNGYLESQAQLRGFQVSSLDPDATTCARLTSAGVDARVGLIENMPFESSSFDVVVATEVLEHLSPASMDKGLGEVSRVLTKGGRLIGTVPYQENLFDGFTVCPECKKVFHRRGHEQSFTVESLSSALARYLKVETCEPAYFPQWSRLNWKGKAGALIRLGLSGVGVHGSSENILFVCRNTTRH